MAATTVKQNKKGRFKKAPAHMFLDVFKTRKAVMYV